MRLLTFPIVMGIVRGGSARRRARRWLATAGVLLAAVFPLAAVAADRANVPLKNWGGFAVSRDAVYDDLERLVTAGLGDRVLLSTKPLSRVEAARIVARAIEKIKRDALGEYNARRDLESVLERLTREFETELAGLGVKLSDQAPSPQRFVSLVPVDRAQVYGGYANHDQSVVNGQGFRFQSGVNGGATFESRAQIGDVLTFYVQPALQGNEEYGTVRLASGYAKLTLYNVELLVGRDSLWWGPALHGSLILSNNAPPLDQVRIGAAEPFLLPWIGQWVGPTKILFFLARLEERRDHPHAKLAGMRATIAPFSFLELGASRVEQFGGDDPPRLKLVEYPEAIVRPSAGDNLLTARQFRNNNLFAVDADLRIRNVDRYLLPARDLRLYGEFGWDDTCCNSNFIPLREALSGLAGVHLLGLFGQDGLDARFEWAQSSHLSFIHGQFRSGYWTRGEVISHVMGTEGRDLYARLTSRLTESLMLGTEAGYTLIGTTVRNLFVPREERTYGGVDVSYRFWQRYSLFAQYQVGKVDNRNHKSGGDGFDHLLRLELTRAFR